MTQELLSEAYGNQNAIIDQSSPFILQNNKNLLQGVKTRIVTLPLGQTTAKRE